MKHPDEVLAPISGSYYGDSHEISSILRDI
jgi:hypothetical protein